MDSSSAGEPSRNSMLLNTLPDRVVRTLAAGDCVSSSSISIGSLTRWDEPEALRDRPDLLDLIGLSTWTEDHIS